ncbi:MAG: GAF domain-containing protein [candidate division Zixibacteria bacterium]|nr:GAF domain-containing protein [candidate division Zixibacteria bacterium]
MEQHELTTPLQQGEKSLGDAIQHVLDQYRSILQSDVVTLILFRKSRPVSLSGSAGPEVRLVDQGWSKTIEPWLVSCDEGLNCQQAIHSLELAGQKLFSPLIADRKIVTISDLEQGWKHFSKGSMPLVHCKSLIFIPVIIGGELFGGVLGAWTQDKHEFSNWDIRVAELVNSQIVMVFRTARLQNSLSQQVQKLHALLELSTVIYSSLDYQVVLKKVIQHSKNLAGADGCTIYRLDHQEQLLRPLITNYDKYYDQIMNFSLKLGEGVTGKVAQTALGIISNSAETDTRTVQIPGTPEEAESIISVPLVWSGEVIGVMTINAKGHKRFKEEDLNLLTILARQVADALENAHLYEDLERAYQELTTAQDKLVRSERLTALGEMAGGVAHDFNNILGSILGRAQILLKATAEPNLVRSLKIIEKSALDGAETVKRIQEFTRAHKESIMTPVDLNKIVEEAIEQTKNKWKDQAAQKGIKIEIIKELSEVGPVNGIAFDLREVVANLIVNGVDAHTQNGAITLTTVQDQENVWLRVGDTGKGMPEAIRKRIFDPFFSTKVVRGTGMGLSVVYGIVSRHKGEISIESEEGKGTTITVKLPLLGSVSAEPQKPKASKKLDRKIRILVVDDDENIRGILNDILSLDGHTVTGVESGIKAIEVFTPEQFDLVITDLGMPGMSGWEVAEGIKAKASNIPIVLISGWGSQIDQRRLDESKADFMLGKPFNIEEIRTVLAEAIIGQPVA